jgi:hypothetical protein
LVGKSKNILLAQPRRGLDDDEVNNIDKEWPNCYARNAFAGGKVLN